MKAVSGIVLALFLIGVLALAFSVQPVRAESRTWYVDDDGGADFTKIQDAIDAANSGDTIHVHSGTYRENVVVDKPVSLFGENAQTTIIDGTETGDCVSVTASSTKISGFTIRNGGSRPSTAYASVRLFTSGNSILNNNLISSWCGVWMEHYSDYNLIANNTIAGNLNGIAGEMWHNTKIIGNTIENNLMGVWIGPYSQNNVVSFNNINGHWSEGIMMMQSSNNVFEGNNIVDNNQGGSCAGITIGFQKGFSSGNKFFHNNIANMGKQVELQGESEPIVWDDGYPSGGNYWSDYVDVDLFSGPHQNMSDGDGIWDHPYVIDADNKDHYPLVEPWEAVSATIDVHPNTINVYSLFGKCVTVYMELAEGYNLDDIDISTVKLNGEVQPESHPIEIGDYDQDGMPDLMLKFDRTDVVRSILRTCEDTVTITGILIGKSFEGSDTIKVVGLP